MAYYGLSNGHVTDDVTWPQRCCEAVRSAILATACLLVYNLLVCVCAESIRLCIGNLVGFYWLAPRATSVKRPLLSVDVYVCLHVCLSVCPQI